MSNLKETCKFSTAYESVNAEHKTAKEAGLSKEEAIEYEKRECASALNAALLKEDASEDKRYSIIHKHLDLLLQSVTAAKAMYD